MRMNFHFYLLMSLTMVLSTTVFMSTPTLLSTKKSQILFAIMTLFDTSLIIQNEERKQHYWLLLTSLSFLHDIFFCESSCELMRVLSSCRFKCHLHYSVIPEHDRQLRLESFSGFILRFLFLCSKWFYYIWETSSVGDYMEYYMKYYMGDCTFVGVHNSLAC